MFPEAVWRCARGPSFAAALVLAVLASGCESSVAEELALARLASPCQLNSDCEAPLVCAFQRCHQACAASRDCEKGERCVAGSQRGHVCQLADERSCPERGSCPGSQVCAVDAQCRDGCASDGACAAEQVCRTGVCADESELKNGHLPESESRPTTTALPCAFNSDCPSPLRCAGGGCRLECSTADDCGREQACLSGGCVELAGSAPDCRYNSDCPGSEVCESGVCHEAEQPESAGCTRDSDCATTGQRCFSGTCACECAVDRDCAPQQTCSNACACVTPAVVEGDVLVSNLKQLAMLDGVVEIKGKLELAIYAPGVYHLPTVRQVGEVRTGGLALSTTYVFDDLESVVGGFECGGGACSVDHLRTVGDLSWSYSSNDSIDLPSLTSAGAVRLTNNPKLRRVLLPALRTATSVEVTGNNALTDIEASALSEVESVVLNGNAALSRLSLPLAAPSTLLNVQYNPALTAVQVLGTQAVDSAAPSSLSVLIWNNDQLASLELPGLAAAKTLQIRRLPKLATLNLAGLTSVNDLFEMSDLAGPQALELPQLKSAGTWELRNTGATTVSASGLEQLGRLRFVDNPLTALELPVKTVAGELYVQSDTLLRLSLPQLVSAATSASSMLLVSAAILSQLDLPALTQVGDLYVAGTLLQELDTLTRPPGPELYAASVQIHNNPLLSDCAIAAFKTSSGTHVAGAFDYSGNLSCP